MAKLREPQLSRCAQEFLSAHRIQVESACSRDAISGDFGFSLGVRAD